MNFSMRGLGTIEILSLFELCEFDKISLLYRPKIALRNSSERRDIILTKSI